ncbi:nuclear transport factor 2 family protein [Flavivirga abyssicola]|uniref:nuclear transport factor 2 family protein n=1 Tax=Flavivirga abyssicola TaxID=3063533 RepID=UPI0026DFBF1E|nr:nuclear transport factor 2 family protein [Flavivirga sp. MEBiC07777]WVK13188.1 nuclear transport factor 2 family protein [Flavivirga sp. MEBiC07777]
MVVKKNEIGNKDIENEKIALLNRVEAFNTAFKVCNIAKLESMLTENYRHTNGISKPIDKRAWVNYLRTRKAQIEKGELVVNTYEMKDTEVELYNNHTAILTAKIVVSSKKQGEIQNNEYRVTNIWIKDDGIWKRAGFHDGKIQ